MSARLAACWGLHAIAPLRIDRPAPFYFLIGPDKPVEAGHIDSVMPEFYRSLIETDSLDKAMTKVDVQFKQFHEARRQRRLKVSVP